MLVNFNNWNKELSQGMMTVRLKRDGGLAHAACNVSEEEMHALVDHERATKTALLSGGPMPQLPDVLRNASRIMSNLKLAHKSMHGSEAQREDMRRTLYAASYQFGMPHFMITLTPSNVSNGMAITIAKSGKVLFDLDDLDTQQRTARIQELVSKDPAACAQYFWEITLFFFREILGCDLEKRTTSEGLFGHVEWIGGGIETQGSQMLHFHVVGRSQRWPSRIVDLRDDEDEDIKSIDDAAMQDSDNETTNAPFDVHDEYADGNQDPDTLNSDQKAFLTDTISRATLPIFEFFVDPESDHCIICPSCTQPLEKVELSIFHQSNRVEQEAYVATCQNPNCRAQHFTPSRLRNACLKKACNLIGSEFDPHADVAAISISPSEPLEAPADHYDGCPAIRKLLLDHIRNPDQPPPELESSMAKYIGDVVRFTVALTSFQEHRYLHCTSCFKKGKKKGMSATICRYGMPRKLRYVTVVNADGVELRRLNGNEFINGYSSLIAMLTHSNHGLRFVFGPEADYCVKYSAKQQGPVNNDGLVNCHQQAVTRSFDRRLRIEAENPDMSLEAIGNARARSLLFHSTNFNQVDSTLAALCILRQGQPFIFLHRTVSLNLRQLMAAAQNTYVTISLQPQTEGGATGYMPVTRYIERTEHKLAVFEFLAAGYHDKAKKSQRGQSTRDDDDSSVIFCLGTGLMLSHATDLACI